ncbi:beta-ketoacyl synthase N-terminal-like domain-containing protein [Streptomyces sp. ID05-39B]|uniref:beta-ketoacyl synthase N-terminal-like domain-containing protein n=1 Tax=Streptomyces sp. ID05-39B TaxID=3028664 RepID=UPI0029A0EAEA|nr:beta-ketoacyl synthase N-terminal-like domain-containing protein [Streptomyces sp. ID05-39B]MDX3529652.1 beta-ketoacyl synthase N-terminal-like domain-containing protein [Streptomyces sp. ID05-39B]
MTTGGGVVVTGLGVHCAAGAGLAAFTDALRAGRSALLPAADRDADSPGAPLPPFDYPALLTERRAHGGWVPQKAARTAARSPLGVQVSVLTAAEAWAHAGLTEEALPPERLGLVVAGNNLTGAGAHRAADRYRDRPAAVPGRYALHMQDTDQVGVVSEVLGIQGEGCTVGGASASGNIALITAARLLDAGAVDACLVLGAPTELAPVERQAYRALGAMTPAATGAATDHEPPCRPFDRAHRGFTDGVGGAAVVLETAAGARRRGARVLARLAGHALRLSGTSLADPSEQVEAAVMRTALERAQVTPGQLGYVNTHGTGSPLGDRTEAAALLRVLGPDAPALVNATKALTGHCLGAAGVVEAVATLAQLAGGFAHPNPWLTDPVEPRLRFAGTAAVPLAAEFALSNSFGFGGFHSAVVFANEGL